MNDTISLQELIAVNNPTKAKALVVKYGFTPARNSNDLIYKLFRVTKENGEQGLQDLAEIHPHKDLLDWKNSSFSSCCGATTSSFNGEPTSSSCGCSSHSNCDGDKMCSACSENKSNMTVDDVTVDITGKKEPDPIKLSTITSKASEVLPLVVVAGIFAITVKILTSAK